MTQGYKGLTLGLVLGPLIASEYMALLHYAVGRGDDFNVEMVLYSPLLALTYYMIMLPIAVISGTPAFLLFERFGWLNVYVVSSYGLMIGCMVAYFGTNQSGASYAAMGSGGFLSALFAWLVINWRSNKVLNQGR